MHDSFVLRVAEDSIAVRSMRFSLPLRSAKRE